MPVYLVTDTHGTGRIMVEAARPAGALSAMIENRFDVSPALDAADALDLMTKGVVFLRAEDAAPIAGEPAAEPEAAEARPALEAFVAAADDDDDAEFADAEPSCDFPAEPYEADETWRHLA